MKVKYKNKNITLPDCIIVGAAKSGTTALFKYLSTYSQVCSSSIKEPWFFSHYNRDFIYIDPKSNNNLSDNIVTDLLQYSNLFENSSEDSICIEASTSYLYKSELAIKNIKQIYGDQYNKLKIIIVLRNPILRAWSHYSMHKRDNLNDLTFFQSIDVDIVASRLKLGWSDSFDYLRLGEYYDDVNNYKTTFNNLKLYLYDDFLDKPKLIMNDIKKFLSIDSEDMPNLAKRYNVSGTPKNFIARYLSQIIFSDNFLKNILKLIFPKKIRYNIKMFVGQILFKQNNIPNKERKFLSDYYKLDISKLSKLINKDLSIWE